MSRKIEMSTVMEVSTWLSPTTLYALYPWIKEDTMRNLYRRNVTLNRSRSRVQRTTDIIMLESQLHEIYGR